MAKKMVAFGAIVVVASAITACSGGESSSAPTSTPPESIATTSTTLALADFAAKYKELMAPLDAENMESSTNALRATTETGIQAAFQPYAEAMRKFNEDALRVQWPEPARTSIRALVDANNAWIATTKLFGTMSLQSVVAKGIEARGKITSATSMVKADLGIL